MTDSIETMESCAPDDFREMPQVGRLLHEEDGFVWMKTAGGMWLKLGTTMELGYHMRFRS